MDSLAEWRERSQIQKFPITKTIPQNQDEKEEQTEEECQHLAVVQFRDDQLEQSQSLMRYLA